MSNLPHNSRVKKVAEIVRDELRNEATADEITFLKSNPNIWRSELIVMKLSCEGQMVASKARRFQNHKRWLEKEITRSEYLQTVADERTWKCNAGRLLQQVETKIQQVNNHEQPDHKVEANE